MPARNDLVTLTFEVNGQVQLDRTLHLLKNSVSQVFNIVGPDIRDDFLVNQKRQFDTQGQHGSGGWRPLSPKYAAWKSAHFPGRPLLVLRGKLRSSLTEKNDPNFIYRAAPLSLYLGSQVPYATYHQSGTDDMPARPPIELVEDQKVRWLRLMQEGIMKSGQGARTLL